METGFEVVAAQSKKTVYEDQPAQETMRGARKITSAPSTDQKKVRRQMAKKADLTFEAGIRSYDDVGFQQRQPGHQHAPQQRQLPGSQPLQPRPPHEHNTRAFACKQCQGYGKDFFGNHCGRCRGTGLSTTSTLDENSKECRLCGGDLKAPDADGNAKCSDCGTSHHIQVKSALDDTKDCRTCGGKLSGQTGNVKCEECGTAHHLQTKSTAIARRAASLLNTPEENV